MLDKALSDFVTIFVTIDPLGLAPLFLALTAGMTRAERGQVALRATLTALAVLLVFALAGLTILSFFGITLAAFRIAGGLLLFYIAFEMIFEKRQERHERSAGRVRVDPDRVRTVAIFPLAIPLIAGPGSISATILLAGHHVLAVGHFVLIAMLIVNVAVAWLALFLADRLERFLGETGRIVLTRLFGLILAALAVQFAADGIIAFVDKTPSS